MRTSTRTGPPYTDVHSSVVDPEIHQMDLPAPACSWTIPTKANAIAGRRILRMLSLLLRGSINRSDISATMNPTRGRARTTTDTKESATMPSPVGKNDG